MSQGTQALSRGLRIIELLSLRSPCGLGPTEIAAQTGIHRTTVQRMLIELQESGWVRRGELGKRYLIPVIGNKSPILVGSEFSHSTNISQEQLNTIFKSMKKIADSVGDAVFLVVRDGNDSVAIHREIGFHPEQVLGSYSGKRHPLGVAAPSMALLAALPDNEAQSVIKSNLDRIKDYIGITPELIWRLRENSKLQGHSIMKNYAVHRTTGVAVAFKIGGNQSIFALGVSGVTNRMSPGRLREIALLLKAEISALSW